MKTGDRIKIRPEWRDPGDEHEIYVIVEANGDRFDIEPVNWPHGDFVPRQTVHADMIEPA